MTRKEIVDNLIHELYLLYSSKKAKNFLEFSKGEKRILVFLDEIENPVSPSDLAKHFGISKQRVTSILNALNEKKYLVLEMNKADRRRIVINLTKKGKDYISKESAKITDELNCLLEKLRVSDLEVLNSLMSKINNCLADDL